MGGFSAHASRTQIIEWLGYFQGEKPRLFLVHGEEKAKLILSEAVKKIGWHPEIPHLGQKITF
jgi:metallo-beta-lactamase family protein